MFWGAAAFSLSLAGCASAPSRNMGSGVVVNAQSGCHAPQPNLRAAYNRTYTIKGRSYTPLRSAEGYEEVGTASWYGWESGSTTSMGTRFNPRDFSAASRVLPLPTCVQVTNLDNGLSALVLVNDRGPFVSSRILDLSMGAAAALGVTRSGTAQVRIVALPDGANSPLQTASIAHLSSDGSAKAAQPMRSAPQAPGVDAPQQFAPLPPTVIAPTPPAALAPPTMTVQALPPLSNTPPVFVASAPASAPSVPEQPSSPSLQAALPQPALTLPENPAVAQQADGSLPVQQTPAVSSGAQTYVQTGAFMLEVNAQTEKARMQAAGIEDVLIVPGYIRGQMFYRVQIGPLTGAPDSTLLQKMQDLGLAQYSVVQQ
ncbi:MAG: septal ring lytic transglycosylase RlpA family protein [Thiomonas sp.]|nr:septal ring lytic transglycosylase RlpA family protein [Thiomonas sp.]